MGGRHGTGLCGGWVDGRWGLANLVDCFVKRHDQRGHAFYQLGSEALFEGERVGVGCAVVAGIIG